MKGVREKYKELVIVGVGMKDSEVNIRKFALDNAISWPTGYDTGDRISEAYGMTFGAGMVFINKDGMIAGRLVAGVTEVKFKEELDKIL